MRARLRQGFSPSRHLRRTDGLQQVVAGSGGQEWILASGLCAYTVLDGAAVPARRRGRFADMAITRWSPFSDPQSHVEWVGDRAMVWAWSKERVLASTPGEPPLPAPRRIIPESLLRGQSRAEGQELVALDEGFEGRVWRDGVLASARWWPQQPAAEEWNQFLRGAGMAPEAAVPEPNRYPLRERGWAAPQMRGFADMVGNQRRLLLGMALAVGTGVLATLLAGVIALKLSIRDVERDVAVREKALQPLLAARESANADAQAIQALVAARPPAGQMELLAATIGLMGGPWQLLEWDSPDPETVSLVARMPNADPRAIVTAWEGSGRFTEVTAEAGRQKDEIIVKAKVKRAAAGSAG